MNVNKVIKANTLSTQEVVTKQYRQQQRGMNKTPSTQTKHTPTRSTTLPLTITLTNLQKNTRHY